MSPQVQVAGIPIGGGAPLVLIAGPCVVEGRDFTVAHAGRLKELAAEANIPLIFKASFDKANRTSGKSHRGPGVESGLEVLAAVKAAHGLPLLTDVHLPEQCALAAQVVDVLQIPAFLCRQTDLLWAAGETGRAVNVKKGQFLAAADMAYAVDKVKSAGSPNVLVTERGTTFGYRDLVVDYRNLGIMREFAPVVFDGTHSVQQPGSAGGATGGNRLLVPPLVRAAVAVGVDAVFLEVHPDPDQAPSDGPNSLDYPLLQQVLASIRRLTA
ncbi:MAG: 3-deoxy-8-phosphooctulonate synthase [Deltaproteobacteria bacterium]|nr:3-deoxy-8-phosphooctulonate synthase [Deltaproteobacteria bacterium]